MNMKGSDRTVAPEEGLKRALYVQALYLIFVCHTRVTAGFRGFILILYLIYLEGNMYNIKHVALLIFYNTFSFKLIFICRPQLQTYTHEHIRLNIQEEHVNVCITLSPAHKNASVQIVWTSSAPTCSMFPKLFTVSSTKHLCVSGLGEVVPAPTLLLPVSIG